MMKRVAEQLELKPALPVVEGNAEYRSYEAELRGISKLLQSSGLEDVFVEQCLVVWLEALRSEAEKDGRSFKMPSEKARGRHQHICRQALRCNIARELTEKEYRKFSRRLAESFLLQWFCLVDRVEKVDVPGKSTLERYDKMLPEFQVRELLGRLNRQTLEETERLGLLEAFTLDVCLTDTTCVKAAIHFPVDWVLLRDGVRTLMKAVKVIRQHGLRHRMPDPDRFLRDINRLSIEMAQSRRRTDSEKRRKTVLRRMKRLTKVVQEHAQRYRLQLETDWKTATDLSEGQMKQIVRRMDGILEQLPEAVRQAHERIIGERRVENSEKILSLYEPDIHVLVRHKAGAEVEFGNTLFLVEQENGLIVDWKLNKDTSPGDIALLEESLPRMTAVFGQPPKAVGADRGFSSQACHQWLEKEKIVDGICPKSPVELAERMKDPEFRRIQGRRAQTEGRIGILKNDYLGRPLLSKSFEHRELAVAWAVLAHNLRLIAQTVREAEEAARKAA